MISLDFRKKMTDSWFSYLQMQICKSFELLENNKSKFSKREWYKKNEKEGGGTSYLLTGGKVFDKVGVNKSTVSGVFPKKFRSQILGAEKKRKILGFWSFSSCSYEKPKNTGNTFQYKVYSDLKRMVRRRDGRYA